MDKKIALKKLMSSCSKQEKCNFDILKKLNEWGFSDSDAGKILQQLINDKYVDDKRYAIAFANDKIKFNFWGKIKVAYVLHQKNINQKFIDYALDNINNTEYFNIIKKEILKKIRTIKNIDKYKQRSKILMFGKSRGYEIDIINKILDSYF